MKITMYNELEDLISEGYALIDAFAAVDLNNFFNSPTSVSMVDSVNDKISSYYSWLNSAKRVLNNQNEINKAKINFLYKNQLSPVPHRYNPISLVTAEKQIEFIGALHNLKIKVDGLVNIMLEIEERNDKSKKRDDTGRNTISTLIIQDPRGTFYYDGKLIELGKETLPYKILAILCSKTNSEGFISYEDIEKELREKGEVPIESKEKQSSRIRNATTNKQQGLFRYAKVGGKKLPNQTLRKGEELIKVIDGKGLMFNNPVLP